MSVDPYAQARIDLNSTVGSQIAAGNVAWAAANYPGAVQAYQLAGQQGASTIGPEIDAVGWPQITQNFTQQAWALNGTLATIDATTAKQSDALLAQTLATKIDALYRSAINAGTGAANAPSQSSSMLTTALVLGAIGVLGGVTFAVMHAASSKAAASTARTTRTTRSSMAPTRRATSARTTRSARRLSQATTRRAV
jgi:hypothetical protein